MNGRLLRTIACFLCIAALNAPVRAEEAQGRFLVLSDLHFNPFHGLTAAEFARLRELPAQRWRDFFAGLKQPPVPLGADSNFTLLDSTLAEAARRIDRPAFVLFGGDFMGHDWQSQYNALSAQSIADNPQAYQEFTAKSLTFLTGEFRRAFPDTAILPTLGNDDALCQDYWVQPRGPFLRIFAQTWQPLLGKTVDAAAFERSFSALGCYTADLPGIPGRRLIALNSVLLSKSYCSRYHAPGKANCCDCTNPGEAPGRAALNWLEASLAQAQRDGRTVWLLMHVPPGLDSYKEERHDASSAAASMWQETFLDRYLAIIDRYRSILQISFAGHTHMDDYRVDRIGNAPVLLHKIIPSISPVFGNNPAFQVYRFDNQTAALTNWQTFFLDLSAAGKAPPSPAWALEYDARKAYGLSTIDAANAAALFLRVRDNPAAPEAVNYRNFFRVGARPIQEPHLLIYACAILNARFEPFRACVTAHNLPEPREMAEPAKLRRTAGGLGDPKP